MWAAEGLSVLCPALEAQHFNIQEAQIAVNIFIVFLLEELTAPGGTGRWGALRPGNQVSAPESHTDRAREVVPLLVTVPSSKKQGNFYFIMSNRTYINLVNQELFSGTKLLFNSAVNKDFLLGGKNL